MERKEIVRQNAYRGAHERFITKVDFFLMNDVISDQQKLKEIQRELDATTEYLLALTSAATIEEIEELVRRKSSI